MFELKSPRLPAVDGLLRESRLRLNLPPVGAVMVREPVLAMTMVS